MENSGDVTRWLDRIGDYFRAVDVNASFCTPLQGVRKKEEMQYDLNPRPFH